MLNIHKTSVYMTGEGIVKIAFNDSNGVYHNTAYSTPIEWRDTREVEYGDTILYYFTVHSNAFLGTISMSQDGRDKFSKTYSLGMGQTLVFSYIVQPI